MDGVGRGGEGLAIFGVGGWGEGGKVERVLDVSVMESEVD